MLIWGMIMRRLMEHGDHRQDHNHRREPRRIIGNSLIFSHHVWRRGTQILYNPSNLRNWNKWKRSKMKVDGDDQKSSFLSTLIMTSWRWGERRALFLRPPTARLDTKGSPSLWWKSRNKERTHGRYMSDECPYVFMSTMQFHLIL